MIKRTVQRQRNQSKIIFFAYITGMLITVQTVEENKDQPNKISIFDSIK